MLACDALLDALQTFLATEASLLAPLADPVVIHLAKAAFTPSMSMLPGDFIEADFDGYLPLEGVVGAQLAFLDPATLRRVVQLKDPAGGWHWESTGVTNLPQDIFGYWLSSNDGLTVYASQLLDTPVTISGSGQGLDVGLSRFTFLPNTPY